MFGRPLKFGGPGLGSGPLKAPAVAGKRDLRSFRSSVASAPENALVCVGAVAPAEETSLKSPAGMSVVLPLLGSEPGATSTRQV